MTGGGRADLGTTRQLAELTITPLLLRFLVYKKTYSPATPYDTLRCSALPYRALPCPTLRTGKGTKRLIYVGVVVGVGGKVKCGNCGKELGSAQGKLIMQCSCGFINCVKCGYCWEPRIKQPKRCPRCTAWLIPRPNEELEGME